MAGERDIARWLAETSLSRAIGRPEPPPPKPAPQRVHLPRPAPPPADLWKTIASRRSRRDYSARPLSLETLAALLWASQGVTSPGLTVSLRAAPSAGALYPVNTWVAARRIENLSPGLWRLDVASFALEAMAVGEGLFARLERAALGQGAVRKAAATIVFTATVERCSSKYGQRAARYIMLDCGHLCQNLLLAAEGLGLGHCPIGAFLDEELNRLLNIDGAREAAIYLATIGHR